MKANAEKREWRLNAGERGRNNVGEMNSSPVPTSRPTSRPPGMTVVSDDDDSSVGTASSDTFTADAVDDDSIGPLPFIPPRQQRNRIQQPSGSPTGAPEGARTGPETQSRCSRRVADGIKAKPRLIADPKFGNILSIEDPNPIFDVLHGNRQTPVLASLARTTRSERKYKAHRDRRVSEYEEHTLNTMD